MEELVGKIIIAKYHYYDIKKKGMNIKKRPFLVIGVENKNPPDLTVLPLSKVSRKENLSIYDYELSKQDMIDLNLDIKDTSYIRTHKQCVINYKDIKSDIKSVDDKNYISDLKNTRNDIYLKIQKRHEEFQNNLW